MTCIDLSYFDSQFINHAWKNFCFLLTSENNFSANLSVTHTCIAVIVAFHNGDPENCFSLYSDYRYNNINFILPSW